MSQIIKRNALFRDLNWSYSSTILFANYVLHWDYWYCKFHSVADIDLSRPFKIYFLKFVELYHTTYTLLLKRVINYKHPLRVFETITLRFFISLQKSKSSFVADTLILTAVFRVSLNLTVAAAWKTMLTFSVRCWRSAEDSPSPGSSQSPLIACTFRRHFGSTSEYSCKIPNQIFRSCHDTFSINLHYKMKYIS